jgi:hypothetical protein
VEALSQYIRVQLSETGTMTYAPRRSKSQSLERGATEGRYVEVRPNTEDVVGANTAKTLTDRHTLSPLNMFTQAESPAKINPAS